ncbi:MAG: transcription initiation factor IIB [Promethearchaeota archaeon]
MAIIEHLFNNDIEHFDHCPECNGLIITLKRNGYSLCNNCGLIINELEFDNLNSIGSHRKYTVDKNTSKRYELINPLVPNISLTTLINRTKIHNSDLRRAVKRDSHLSWKNRSLLNAITELRRVSHILSLPKYIQYESLRYYKRIIKNNCLKGRSIIGMINACIYYVCRKEKLPRCFQEIIDICSVSETKIKKCYKLLITELNLKLPSTNPMIYIPRYINELCLTPNIELKANFIMKKYFKAVNTYGKNPKGICAGVIYLVCKLNNIKIRQKRIAEVIGITEITLRARYKEIIQSLNIRL